MSAPAYTLQAPHDNIDLFKYQPETVGAVGARDVTSLITIQMFPPSHADYGGYLLPPFLPPPPHPTLHSPQSLHAHQSLASSHCTGDWRDCMWLGWCLLPLTGWLTGCCKLLNKFSLLKWRVKITLCAALTIFCVLEKFANYTEWGGRGMWLEPKTPTSSLLLYWIGKNKLVRHNR